MTTNDDRSPRANEILDEVKTVMGEDVELVMVGGAVRDLLRGVDPKDYDFATPLGADDIERRVKDAGKHTFVTGKRFGTIGFKMGDEFAEVTTYRREKYEPWSRKPIVEFEASLEDDLSRRDFTINAMAFTQDGIVDPFGGLKDLEAKLIKAVGDPIDRFSDDPLRILRMIRFVSTLGFDIDAETLRAAKVLTDKVASLSPERISNETEKILMGEYVEKAGEIIEELKILPIVSPVFTTIVKDVNWNKIRKAENTPESKWAMLLLEAMRKKDYLSNPYCIMRYLRCAAFDLHWSKDRLEELERVILSTDV